MQGSHCDHHHTHKIGLSRHKRQRWICMGAWGAWGAAAPSVQKDQRLIDPQIKAFALRMYAEGIAARKIERLLGVSHNSVLGWVRKEVESKALQPVEPERLSEVEIDEMWSFIGTKNSPSGCGGQ